MKIVIIGAGTAATNVSDILVQDRNFTIYGFVGIADEEARMTGKKFFNDIPFIGDRSILKRLKEDDVVGFVAAIGDNMLREEAYYEASLAGLTPVNAVSRHAIIEPSAKIEKGVVISAGCIVSHGVSIGNNSYLGTGVIVEINTRIGENCYLAAGSIIGGECEVGRNVKLSIRSTVKSYKKIGKNQTIFVGQVVEEDLPDLVRGPSETGR